MWTSVITQLSYMDPDQNGATRPPPGNDTLIWTSGYEASEWDTPLDVILFELTAKDPIHVTHTFDFVNLRLHDLVQRAGGEQAFERDWAANVDKEVLSGLFSCFYSGWFGRAGSLLASLDCLHLS